MRNCIINPPNQYEALFIDLDNTLISENEYLFYAYQQIGKYLASIGISTENNISRFLKNKFLLEGRERLFDKLIRHFSIDAHLQPKLLDILRNVTLKQNLTVNPHLVARLNKYFNHCMFVIVTNGNPDQQRNKIKQTDWRTLALKQLPPLLCNLYEPKPSALAILSFFKRYNIKERKTFLFIGDALSDYHCALSAGVDFIHVDDFLKQFSCE